MVSDDDRGWGGRRQGPLAQAESRSDGEAGPDEGRRGGEDLLADAVLPGGLDGEVALLTGPSPVSPLLSRLVALFLALLERTS